MPFKVSLMNQKYHVILNWQLLVLDGWSLAEEEYPPKGQEVQKVASGGPSLDGNYLWQPFTPHATPLVRSSISPPRQGSLPFEIILRALELRGIFLE